MQNYLHHRHCPNPRDERFFRVGMQRSFSERHMTQWRPTNFASSFKLTLVTLVPQLFSSCAVFFLWKKPHLLRSPWVLPEKQNSGPLPEHETQLLGRLLQGAWLRCLFFLVHPQKTTIFREKHLRFFEKAEKSHRSSERGGFWWKKKRWNSILSKWVN